MAQRLDRFDAERISAGLQGARQFIDSHSGIVEQRTFIEQERSDLLVALYEALCCITFLKQPENRVNFNYVFTAVQQKRVLKLAEVLPTMTRFLFDEDKTRLAFARASWSRMPQVSADEFEWAVKGCLEDAMQKVNTGDASLPQLQLFWEGIALILNALDPKCFVPALDSLSVQPSLYHLMLSNMSVNSESNLAAVLKVFNMTLQKGPKGLWNCFANFPPAGVAEPVFASPAFKRLLAQTREYSISMPEDNYLKGPVAIAWIKPFIGSIHVNQKSDACDSFLHYLLDDIAKDNMVPAEGRMACFRGAAEALLTSTNAFLDSNSKLNLSGQPAIFTNRIINLVVKHKDVLSLMVKLDRSNTVLSRLAVSVVAAVLRLDSLVTAAEYFANDNDRPVQREIIKKSPELWSSCLSLLVPGATELAKAVLKALLPLSHVESFRPDKKTKLLPAAKEEFNANFRKVAENIGDVFNKFEDFGPSDLNQLIDSETTEPVVVALIHGEPAIHRGALAFVKTVTGETTRSDAILELLKSHFSTVLVSFAKALTPSKDTKPWSPQQQILRYLKDVLDSLCDPRDGLLRSMNLNNAERAALKQWWSMSWTAIDNAFEGLDYWSKSVDMDTMKEFCRQTMELAESFLAQDGLMCSALGPQSIREGMLNPSENSKPAMQDILEPPKEKCMGMTTMLRLKDKYLVQVTVNVLGKLLRRLIEFDVVVPPAVIKYVQRTCVKTPQGKYEVPTNLNDQQRAELLRAVGEDEDDIQILDIKKFEASKKQSRLDLDAWSKSGDALSKPIKTTQDHVRGMTPTLEKNRSTLDQFRAASRQSAKTTLKPVASKPAPQRLDAAQLARLKDARMKAQEEKKKRDAEAIAKAKALRAPQSLVPGEGSGIQGLTGVLGKDHTPKGDMMVNSDDEDDEFDSEDDAAFRAQTQAGKKRAEDASLQRVMQLKAQVGPVKKMKIQRSAKDMRARLIPSMAVLHKEILEWDIFHEGNDPPNGVKCSRVSSNYGDPRQYKETFLPLLIYEAWRSFVTDKNETTSKAFGIKVASRMNVDNFTEVTTTMPLKTDSKDEFLSEGDIVLISASAQPLEGRDDPHCLSRVSRVQIRYGAREVSYRISSKATRIIPLLAPKAEMYAVKITNMRTIEREFASLESLQYYDLMQEILEAKPSPMLNFSSEAIDKVKINYHLNHGQAKAVLHARENDAFTLVQG
jgi:senataxin